MKELKKYLLENVRDEEIEKTIQTNHTFVGDDGKDYQGRQTLNINFFDNDVEFNVKEYYFDPEIKEWVNTESEYSDEDIFKTFFNK